MFNVLKSCKAILDVISVMYLPNDQRRIIFYGEGKNYWPHLQGLIEAVLAEYPAPICYLSSSMDDPGLAFQHDNFQSFFIGEGFIRDYLFQNINADILVMTMPDLHQYQVKRSCHDVHYIYVQHSLVSLHMVYADGAFNHYDSICCAGPHHVREMRAIEKMHQLPAKNLIELGYSRLDDLIKTADEKKQMDGNSKKTASQKCVLIAPSWGRQGVIESGLGDRLVSELLQLGHQVILRPHPQTAKFAKQQLDKIIKQHRGNPAFIFEQNIAGQDSLHRCDMMVSDWSGAALEYAFALKKPVIFCDVPRKVNNPHYQDIDLIPLEVSIRDKIGVLWDCDEPIAEILTQSDHVTEDTITKLLHENVFNVSVSNQIFAKSLLKMLKEK